MSPLNRGPLMGPRIPPPRFVGRLTPRHGMPPRMPPPPPPLNPMFGPGGPRQRLPPPPRSGVSRPNGMLPRFPGGPRARGMAPIVPPMGPRGSGLPLGPPMRPWPRRMPLPPQMMPMRPRFASERMGNGNAKGKAMGSSKKSKFDDLELKKPWMTDEIRNEIQRKNKLYAKAKKNKEAVEWEEFKDIRNRVTRMIRDAKNEYLAKHPEQAHLYPVDEEPYDQRDENNVSSDDDDAPHYCEVCDRDFPSEDALVEHKSTHMLCGIDDCTFSAHPMLVQKHISMQHRTGLYQRIKDLSTPEDIEKWITERKKRYPTEENIKLRKAEEQEKLQRGEVIKENSNVHMKMKKNMREKKRKPRKRRTYETNNSFHAVETYRGLHPFPGISVLQEDSLACSDEQVGQTDLQENVIDNISDEDDVPQAPTTPESTNLPVISLPVLPILVADYESEDDDEGPEEVPVKKVKIEEQDTKVTDDTIKEEDSVQVCEKTSDTRSDTSAGDNSSNKQINENSNNKSQDTVAKYQNKQIPETNRILANNKNERILHRYRNKLLEKLLSRSIQHERNLICQCVKYIIENNFFDCN
ncbi:PREDICTED: nuclear fragile X mental retardation-interacting protein 1 [Vollenhovia emeryi]|uniref:nuclear fragile X mental retardation-interacting protein 1 n=1 Tax=Vollenhovia emeryi TaxID=411798 RepID=UPI0005F3C8F8|nr:PREDICTED: nuclear fragile X mental retardation-interacting protein 1 [Vollenhovia emeryi]